jgi:hypothetical protein
MSAAATLDEPRALPARSRLFWGVLGALAAGQLFAFWLVCTHQVRKAEARQNEVLVQQMALNDCLQYIAGSTIASCTVRTAVAAQTRAQREGSAATSVAVPVSFSYR